MWIELPLGMMVLLQSGQQTHCAHDVGREIDYEVTKREIEYQKNMKMGIIVGAVNRSFEEFFSL